MPTTVARANAAPRAELLALGGIASADATHLGELVCRRRALLRDWQARVRRDGIPLIELAYRVVVPPSSPSSPGFDTRASTSSNSSTRRCSRSARTGRRWRNTARSAYLLELCDGRRARPARGVLSTESPAGLPAAPLLPACPTSPSSASPSSRATTAWASRPSPRSTASRSPSTRARWSPSSARRGRARLRPAKPAGLPRPAHPRAPTTSTGRGGGAACPPPSSPKSQPPHRLRLPVLQPPQTGTARRRERGAPAALRGGAPEPSAWPARARHARAGGARGSRVHHRPQGAVGGPAAAGLPSPGPWWANPALRSWRTSPPATSIAPRARPSSRSSASSTTRGAPSSS